MKSALLFLCVLLTGCEVQVSAGGGHLDHELYARVFNQCVHDAGSNHAFEEDSINACRESAREIATTPDVSKEKP